jgi:hypothetical protein
MRFFAIYAKTTYRMRDRSFSTQSIQTCRVSFRPKVALGRRSSLLVPSIAKQTAVFFKEAHDLSSIIVRFDDNVFQQEADRIARYAPRQVLLSE